MLERTTANATFPKLDMFVGFGLERERIRKLKESGAPPPWTDDPILAKYRFCNVNVQDDRGSRAIFELVTKPYADHPGLIVALTVCRFINSPEIFEAVRDCLVPFDPERFVAIMADRKARGLPLAGPAYMIPGGVKGELKAHSLTKDLFIPLAAAVESVRPKPGDTCEQVFERLRQFQYLGDGFLTAQIVRDLKQDEPLRSAPDSNTFVRSGPGSQRGLNRVCGATDMAAIERERPEAEWQSLFWKMFALVEPRFAEHGITLDAQSWQNVLCEFDKYCRFRSGDLRKPRHYVPGGKTRPARVRKPKVTPPTPASIKPTETPSALPQLAAVRPPKPVIAPRDSGPHVLHRDVETRGVLVLGKVGVHRYAGDPRTEVLCVAYAVDNEPVQLWLPGDPVPPEFIEAANNPNWIAVAHNAAFEMAIEQHILGPRFGWPLIPSRAATLHDGDGAGAIAAGQIGERRTCARAAAPER